MSTEFETLADLIGHAAANEVVAAYGGVREAIKAGMEVARIPRIGQVKARRLLAAHELARLTSEPPRRGTVFRSASEVWQTLEPDMRNLEQEEFRVLYLDTRNRLLKTETLFRGTLNSCPVHPREVFKSALRESAAAMILTHNHPSGDPTPSGDDIALTIRLKEAGEILGIKILDHIVIGSEGYTSLAERGYLG